MPRFVKLNGKLNGETWVRADAVECVGASSSARGCADVYLACGHAFTVHGDVSEVLAKIVTGTSDDADRPVERNGSCTAAL